MNESDELLLEYLQRGNEQAFETLFLRHYERVYRVLFRLVYKHEEVEDLVQDIFLNLYQAPPNLAPGTSLTAWLYRVALNRGYNALRGQKQRQKQLARMVQTESSKLFLTNDPAEEIVRSEEQEKIRAVLLKLPERQGKLLSLRYAGFSYHEIALILDIAPDSVGPLLVRAKRTFLKSFGSEAGTALVPQERTK